MGVLDKMLDMEVRRAFLERKKGSYNVPEEELAQLSDYILSDACTEEIARLKDGDFFFEPPRLTMLRKKSSGKRRRIYRFRDNEAMIMKLMAFVMHDFDWLYSDSLYSFRVGRHISGIFREISKNDYSRTHWVIKSDISSFGDSVDPDILVGQLEELFGESDRPLFDFFKALLTRGEYIERDGSLIHGPTGAMSGCALTNFFENIYLRDVDDMIISRSSYYCRFADDMAIFFAERKDAEETYDILKSQLSERGLAFNTSKTDIVAPGETFELLGFSVSAGEYDISENSMQKIEWKLRHYADRLIRLQRRDLITASEAEQRMIDRIDRYFFGADRFRNELNWVDWSFSVLTRCDSLKRLDECAQDCIRIAGSGGKRNRARYRVRYNEMRARGYRTLVHAYYHGYDRTGEDNVTVRKKVMKSI